MRLDVESRERAAALLRRWRDHPELFAREVLGTRRPNIDGSMQWTPMRVWKRQEDILRAVASMAAAKEHRTFPGMLDIGQRRKLAVRSGHKVSKSTTAAILSLWFWSTRDRARVVLSSSSARQVRSVLWKEIRRLHGNAKAPLGGAPAKDPDTGLQLPDGREIVGVSTNEPERLAGFSGPNMLFIVDEASGVPDEMIEAVEGNTAGGAIIVLLSNPTKTSGKFFDAFHDSADFYEQVHVSSEEAAALDPPIPGLATPEWVEQMRAEYGEQSPIFQVRVRGEFPSQGDNAVIPLPFVENAVKRWRASALAGEAYSGRLEIGVDPARYGGDESVIAPRRGPRALPMRVFSKLDEPALTEKILGVARELRRGDEKVIVRVDAVGVGQGVLSLLRTSPECSGDGAWLIVVAVYVTDEATDARFATLRDQLWWAIRDWLRADGEIPKDSRLDKELRTPTYKIDARGRIKVESKDDLKPRLDGRSPDRADALALAVYVGNDDSAARVLLGTGSLGRARFATGASEDRARLLDVDVDEDDD